MKKINLQKNKACPPSRRVGSRRGFVILFAVVISTIILSITLGVANVAFREVKFGTSAKETNFSFFAADTGIECALFNDKPPSAFPLPGPSTGVACASSLPTFIGDSNGGIYTFFVTGLGVTGINCAKVTVQKTKSGSDVLTTVIAKGYNVGGDDSSCSSSNPSRIEREIKVNY